MNRIICSMIFLLCCFTNCMADLITLNNGTELKCVVITKDKKALLAETHYGSMNLALSTIRDIKSDTAVNNLILRADFAREKGKYDQALRYYQDALVVEPKNTDLKDKYNDLRKKVDQLHKKEAMNKGNLKDERPSITSEDAAAATQAKNIKIGSDMVTLQAEGSAEFPLYSIHQKEAEKATLQMAVVDALRKIMKNNVGIGFRAVGPSVTILPEGEIPNCKINFIEKKKANNGYKVSISLVGPSNSVFVDLPSNYPLTEATGISKNLRAKNKTEIRERTILIALEEGVRQEVEKKIAADTDKNKYKKVYAGRVFPVRVLGDNLIAQGYMVRLSMQVWFDPNTKDKR
jgi:hypothetical protein